MTKSSESFGVERWLLGRLRPWAFFVGVALGFAGCCLAGRLLTEHNCFKNFQRFHDYINPATDYFPTALQVQALVKAKIPAGKIAVIIGGDSILHGCGQGAKQLWSEHLERELGEPFRVLNLAFPGGGPNEHGLLATELLRSKGKSVIYVCDSNIAHFCSEVDYTSDTYRYLFHDALAHDLLAHFPERDQALKKLNEHELSSTYEELRSRAWANAYLGFNDFWHILGYRFSFTIWSPRLQSTRYEAFGPRRKCLEPETLNPDPSVEKRNANPHYGENLAAMRRSARSLDDFDWKSFESKVRSVLDRDLRARTIVIVTRKNPYYAERLEREMSGATERVMRNIQTTVKHLNACGVRALEGCTTLDSSDYWDFQHLTAEGGRKLAEELVPRVRKLASELGYISE